MNVVTKIRVLDGPDAGRHSLFLGMGLSSDHTRYELAESAELVAELRMLNAVIQTTLRDLGFDEAYATAEHLSRCNTLRVYEREAHTPWYRTPRYSFAGRFTLQVEDGPERLRLVAGAKILDALPECVAGRVTSAFDAALTRVEKRATQFSAIVAALETGAVRAAASAAAAAVADSVTDARRLAVVGTQLDGVRAERVLREIEALERTVDAAVGEALELHLSVRETTPRGLDALPAASQLRAITDGVRELS